MGRRVRGGIVRAVAKRAGVSPATVSRVLNHYPNVRGEVRRHVLSSLEALGYSPHAARRARRSTGTLGLIVPDITNPFYAEASNIIIATCQGRGYNVILCNSENLPGLHREQVALLRRRRVDGILFGSVLYDDAETEALIASGYPCLLFNRRLRSGRGSYVVADNVEAGRQITEHLIRLGHRRIGFITGASEASTAYERLEGYRQAMPAGGLTVEPEWIAEGAYKPKAALRAADALLKRGDRPTAIIAANDAMALSTLDAAGRLGMAVPGDLAVAGIDDIEIAAHHNIQLTTVSHHAAEMAELAATWVMEIVQDPERFVAQPFQYVIRPSLVVRRTCGAALTSGRHR